MNKKLLLMSFCAFMIGGYSITSVGFCDRVNSLEITPTSEEIPHLTLFSKDISDVWKFHATNDGLLRILRKSGTNTDSERVVGVGEGRGGRGSWGSRLES